MNQFKLGRKSYIRDKRDLKLKNYLDTSQLPPLPEVFGHQALITNWGMLGNDTVGDCVIAGADHETLLWCQEGGNSISFTDANAINDYSVITGYDPNDPNSDQGTDVRAALKYRQKTGMVDSEGKRHKIGAYLQLDQSNLNEVLMAAYLFSAVGIGINFPSSAMDQFNQGNPWTVVEGSAIEGGHYFPIVGYDGTYLYCVTWGQVQKMDVNFFKAYCEEAWAILSTEFLNNKSLSPEGFNLAQLQADLAAITKTPIPTPSPEPTPSPQPTPSPRPTPDNPAQDLLEEIYQEIGDFLQQ